MTENTLTSTTTVQLAITGMTCDGCAANVTTALTALDGVRSVSVDHSTGAAVAFLAADADPESFAFDADAALHDAGYTLESASLGLPMAGSATPAEGGCCGGGGCC